MGWISTIKSYFSTPASVAGGGGWFTTIRESFSGAWQNNIEERRGSFLCYPALYACISAIAQDIGILPFKMRREQQGIWVDAPADRITALLANPNHYQTGQQFREAWQLSKLTQGNAYILKQRDDRGNIVKLYVLDPERVMPLVSESGDIFYQLYTDNLNLVLEAYNQGLAIPASEIIHDREVALHHPLIGIPPVCAAYWPAVKNLKILRSSADFFNNNAQPGGLLSAPGAISADTAKTLADYFNQNFTGRNSGKIAAVGDGLQYTPLAGRAIDSQLVEQMRYSDEQICQAFRVPPFIIGLGTIPAGMKADDMAMTYHRRALQPRIEHMENLLDRGLAIKYPMGVEADLWPLLRMDTSKLADVEVKLVGGKIKTPNEGRLSFDLPPVEGGESVWLQQQDYPMQVLAELHSAEVSGVSVPDGNQSIGDNSGSIQQEALNGAQVTALQGIIFSAASGALDIETAAALIRVAFPLVSEEEIQAMLANVSNLEPDPDPDPDTSKSYIATQKAIIAMHNSARMQHAL